MYSTLRSGPTSVTLSSGDIDVFVCLLYHFTVNGRDLGLHELWLVQNSGVKRSILLLHDVCTALGNNFIKYFPADALTECDTTSKIATSMQHYVLFKNQKNIHCCLTSTLHG